uniref:Uncharacterized protein n=1 Tax=Oryza sativa subsp. japonica TaxID=39947 RepID=Q6K5Z1_ORYSJ|nr:hypothetical protein [Oryza sativa Japonica Group]
MGGVSLPHRHPAPPPFFASLPPKQAARKPRGCKDDGGAFPLPPWSHRELRENGETLARATWDGGG